MAADRLAQRRDGGGGRLAAADDEWLNGGGSAAGWAADDQQAVAVDRRPGQCEVRAEELKAKGRGAGRRAGEGLRCEEDDQTNQSASRAAADSRAVRQTISQRVGQSSDGDATIAILLAS